MTNSLTILAGTAAALTTNVRERIRVIGDTISDKRALRQLEKIPDNGNRRGSYNFDEFIRTCGPEQKANFVNDLGDLKIANLLPYCNVLEKLLDGNYGQFDNDSVIHASFLLRTIYKTQADNSVRSYAEALPEDGFREALPRQSPEAIRLYKIWHDSNTDSGGVRDQAVRTWSSLGKKAAERGFADVAQHLIAQLTPGLDVATTFQRTPPRGWAGHGRRMVTIAVKDVIQRHIDGVRKEWSVHQHSELPQSSPLLSGNPHPRLIPGLIAPKVG